MFPVGFALENGYNCIQGLFEEAHEAEVFGCSALEVLTGKIHLEIADHEDPNEEEGSYQRVKDASDKG